jgi:hopanoid biosynthesis associated protein HpnK
MVGAPAAAEAVDLARRLPGLHVGLHLAVVDGLPTLPPSEVGGLVDRRGVLRSDLLVAGIRFFFHPLVRAQLAREIRAQFEAFRATGLELDHVNAHHHMHLHPSVGALLIEIGREYGLRAVRVPREPASALSRTGDVPRGARSGRSLGVWVALLRARLRRAGLRFNDQLFGLAWTGAVTEARILKLLPHLPPGVTELYCHPAMGSGSPSSDGPAAELAALMSPAVSRGIVEHGIRLSTFGDLEGSSP